MKTLTIFILGMTVGLSFGYVLATSAGDFAAELNRQQQLDYNTWNAIQQYRFEERPSTAIPFESYSPSRYPCY